MSADTGGTATGVVCTPLEFERLALRGRLATEPVRTGRARGGAARGRPVLVAGVAGGLARGIRAGDLVVADEVRADGTVTPSHAAPMLTGALRRLGLDVHCGPVVSATHVVDSIAERDALARHGALAVDTESALLTEPAPPGQGAVIRAVVDTVDEPLLHPGTLIRGPRAFRALRRAAPAIDAWVAATADREVVLAGPRSFCAGVERAIKVVERALDRFGAPVYVRRQIVHNVHVVRDLERRGAIFVEEADEVPPGSVLVLAAHGVAPDVHRQAEQRRLRVVDATCPLVSKVHAEVRRFADRDHTVFLIGHRDHEEVVGTQGEAPGNVVVVPDANAAANAEAADPDKVAYVMQTTLAVSEAEDTAAVLRDRFPALAGPRTEDICYATTNRQQAVRAVADESDLVLVLGSQNSSNSQRLAEVAESAGVPAHLVDDAESVDLGWLAGATRIGVTAGASAPPELVDDLVRALSGLGEVTVRNVDVVSENVRFTLPKEVH